MGYRIMKDYYKALEEIQDGTCPVCEKGLTDHDFDSWGVEGKARCLPCGLVYSHHYDEQYYEFMYNSADSITVNHDVLNADEITDVAQLEKEMQSMTKLTLLVNRHSKALKASLHFKDELTELYNNTEWRDKKTGFVYSDKVYKIGVAFAEMYTEKNLAERIKGEYSFTEDELKLIGILFQSHLEVSEDGTSHYCNV